jgi:hypothetical protein
VNEIKSLVSRTKEEEKKEAFKASTLRTLLPKFLNKSMNLKQIRKHFAQKSIPVTEDWLRKELNLILSEESNK